jgi:hypothetical protein
MQHNLKACESSSSGLSARLGLWIVIGGSIGVALGLSLADLTLGMAIGVSIGVLIGMLQI